MDNICFIPARNSSTRFKNKNISIFKDSNLVTRTIKQAIDSKVFDRIVLSSNDKEILEMGKPYDIELHLRDDKFDQIIGVMQEAIPNLQIENDDTIGLLLVTCPLREVKDIQNAYEIFMSNDRYHTVISVRQNMNPIQMAFKTDAGGHLEAVMPDEMNRSTRKQDHYDTFFYNDAIIFDIAKEFMKQGRNLYGDNAIPYLMPWERSIAIDYEFQLKIAKCLVKKEKNNGKI